MFRWLRNGFRSSLLAEVDGVLDRATWTRQIYQAIARHKQRALTEAETQQLLSELHLHFQEDWETKATLAEDVKVLCFFVRLRFSDEPITLSNFAPLFDEVPTVSISRYRTLIEPLLTEELKEWQLFFSQPAQVNLQALHERLGAIQRLRYLEYPLTRNNNETSTLPPLDNLEESNFGQWLFLLLSYYWQHLSRIVQQWVLGHGVDEILRHKSTDYLAVADNMQQLMLPFQSQLDSSQQAHYYETLHQWYAQGSHFWSQQPYFFDSQLARFPEGGGSWKQELQSIQRSLQQDREQLTQWAEFAFKSALMQLQVNEEQGMKSYLHTYQQLQEKVQAFSTAAWAYRSRCELRLRTLSASNEEEQRLLYLQSLQTLDNMLRRQFSKFTGIVWDCFSSFSSFNGSPATQDLKNFLTYLNLESQSLFSLTQWLHHSCYCNDATEGMMTYEMNQYLAEANYSPAIRYQERSTVLTMADHVVQCLAPKAWDKALKARLHPDKHPSYLAPIANYGFNQIESLQKQAKLLIRRWQQGQWASAAPPNTLRLTTSESLSVIEQQASALTRIERPIVPLDLSVIDLKAAYIQKIKTKADLTKYPPELSDDFTHRLYEGNDNERDRETWELKQVSRRIRRKHEKELAEIRRETAGHNQRADEYRREKEELNRESEQIRLETEKMRQNFKRAVVLTLTKELVLALEQRRPTTAEEVYALLDEIMTAVPTKPGHEAEAYRIAVSNWQREDIYNVLLGIINNRDDMQDLAHLLGLSQTESTEINQSSQARNQHRLFSEANPFSTEVDYSLLPRQSFVS